MGAAPAVAAARDPADAAHHRSQGAARGMLHHCIGRVRLRQACCMHGPPPFGVSAGEVRVIEQTDDRKGCARRKNVRRRAESAIAYVRLLLQMESPRVPLARVGRFTRHDGDGTRNHPPVPLSREACHSALDPVGTRAAVGIGECKHFPFRHPDARIARGVGTRLRLMQDTHGEEPVRGKGERGRRRVVHHQHFETIARIRLAQQGVHACGQCIILSEGGDNHGDERMCSGRMRHAVECYPMRVTEHTIADADAWAREAAQWIAARLRDSIVQRGACTLGLSGGSTPAPVYRTLAGEHIDWSRVTVFLADERLTDPQDPQSNQYLVRSTLLDALAVPPTTLFPDTLLPPDACADAYDRTLRDLLAEKGPDVLALGLGTDGHTASLFPPVPPIPAERFALHAQTDSHPVFDRISVTPRVLQAAQHPVFLLKGPKKRDVWQALLAAPFDPAHCPAHDALAGGTATLFGCW